MAFSNAALLAMLRGGCTFVILLVIAFSRFNNPLTGVRTTASGQRGLPAVVAVARLHDEPSASVRQFMELAAKHAGQGHQVGRAERSRTVTFDRQRLSGPRLNHGINQIQR